MWFEEHRTLSLWPWVHSRVKPLDYSGRTSQTEFVPDKQCGHKRAAECPARHGGGLVIVEPKSQAGRRVVSIPPPLALALLEHRQIQAKERHQAANLWQDDG